MSTSHAEQLAPSEPAFPLMLAAPEWQASVKANCPIPLGWTPEPLKHDDRRDHQVWISPGGNTAFGVIAFSHFLLRFAPDDAVLTEVLKGLRDSQGEANLLARQKDSRLYGEGGIRFVAEGGKYLVRANLVTRGNSGWVIYAGTLRNHEIDPAELAQAEAARERTRLDAPAMAGAGND